MKILIVSFLVVLFSNKVNAQSIEKFKTNTLTTSTLVNGVWVDKGTVNFSANIIFDYASDKIKFSSTKIEEFDIVNVKTESNSKFYKVLDSDGEECFFQIGNVIFEGKTITIVTHYTSKNNYSYSVTKI